MTNAIILKQGKEKSLLRRHPWIFSGAVATVEGGPKPGETVQIRGDDQTPYGWASYSPESQIRARMWTFEPDEEVSPTFFRTRVIHALVARMPMLAREELMAYRLVHGESDGLPGLIIDRYDSVLVCQFLSAGAEYWKQEIVEQLQEFVPYTGIYERSDADVRKKEGLQPQVGLLSGEEPPELIEIREGNSRFLVNIRRGHKTGFYLDQRSNRRFVETYTETAEVLNCFAYTGSFGIAALHGEAKSVTNIESSASVLKLAERHVELNQFDPSLVENVEGDVFHVLRKYRDQGRHFDVIILDPPRFAESRSQIQRASRGYKDINLLAFKLLRRGGILVTFSCSGLIAPGLFQKIVADAALDARREAHILHWLTQSADHPTALNFPEANYLKGLVCRVL